MSCLRAIVVDDGNNVDILRDRLAVLGHEVVGVGSISEAREHVSQEHYDYMLLDMALPAHPGAKVSPKSGLTFLKELRETFTQDQLPVIMITGSAVNDSSLISNMFRAGASDYIEFTQTDGHTIEDAVMDAVLKPRRRALAEGRRKRQEKAPATPEAAGTPWLTCTRDQDGNLKHWTTTGKGGLVRHFTTRVNTAINKVLECIEHNHTMLECIVKHGEFIDKHIWKDEKTYFGGRAYEGNAANRPIRHHLNRIRKELGIGYKSLKGGYQFTRPEN